MLEPNMSLSSTSKATACRGTADPLIGYHGRKMLETVYTKHLKGRKVLLETPTGFAVFLVKEFAFQQDKNIWVHFSDPEYAIQALVALGFRKVDDKSLARNCDDGPGKDLEQLIKKFCKTGETLIVQDQDLKSSIQGKIGITCKCDGYAVGEVIWGIKNVLHEFIPEEEFNITLEYCLPVSEGLKEALQYYAVNIPIEKIDKPFISKFGFLCHLDMNLESFPKELLRSFDKYVGIGDTIKGLDYAKVLALVLVPELVEEHDFAKTFTHDLDATLRRAELFQANRKDDLTMHDIEKIMGYLDYLLNVPELRDKILMEVKLIEVKCFKSHLSQKFGQDAVERINIGVSVDFTKVEYRRVLLETPSGFALFNVREDMFRNSEHIWPFFSDRLGVHNIVFALGFITVDEKSVVRDSTIGPGDKLEQLILRFHNAKQNLVVQDTELKSIIESKLDVKCWTGDEVVNEVIWGLKFVLCDFISGEGDKLTDKYLSPLSKELLQDLKTYGINVSTSEINANLICAFGNVKILDMIDKITSKALRDKCHSYVSEIVFSEDDATYASIIAKFLLSEFEQEIGLPEVAGDLGSKLMDLPKYAGKAIPNCDKEEILQYLKRLAFVYKEKKHACQVLKQYLPKDCTIEPQIVVSRISVLGSNKGKTETMASNKNSPSAAANKGETKVTIKGKTKKNRKG